MPANKFVFVKVKVTFLDSNGIFSFVVRADDEATITEKIDEAFVIKVVLEEEKINLEKGTFNFSIVRASRGEYNKSRHHRDFSLVNPINKPAPVAP